ncbi:MAG: osmoprotectant transport system ATP-binding protein [Candidatus Azotimanducaceae bacterium]|jgi:osmoprotectant transport system ATP-binding protein
MVIPDLQLTIQADLTTAIVGESGSGKSTLLQLINGLVIPDTGNVLIGGDLLDYANLTRVRRQMGYAVQGAGLFPHMTIYDNVTLMARLESWSSDKVEQRYQYLFDLMDLDRDFADRFPNSLSGGQQQRVSLCRAMMLNPPLLLLDEPFSALDPITRRGIHEEFTRLQAAESRTIILVTHDIAEAAKLAQQLIILREGKIVQQGTPQTVAEHPADQYVANLMSLQGGGS